MDGRIHRKSYEPGDDISHLPDAVRAAIEAHWTPERVAAWEASLPDEDDEPETDGPRRVRPAHFIRRLRELGKYDAALDHIGGPGSADYAELVSADWIGEDEERVIDGLAAVGVSLDEMFGQGG